MSELPNTIVRIDRDTTGRIKPTRFGDIRFSLVIQGESEIGHMTVKGFRYNLDVRRIVPPSTPLPKGTYDVVELSREMEEFVVAALMEAVEAAGGATELLSFRQNQPRFQ